MKHEFRNQRKQVDFQSLDAGDVFVSHTTFAGDPCLVICGEVYMEAVHLLTGEVFRPEDFDTVTPYKATVILE